ncbi:MAG: hypothetical protein Fur0022_41950 [Anaerolineales bacterium]
MSDHSSESLHKGRVTVDQMLRTTQQHHVQLSQMADQKASLLFGIEALLFTILIRDILTANLSYWAITLAIAILLSIFFALLAVMPSIHPPKYDAKHPDWLFFASFAQMEIDEYMEKMWAICQDDHEVYTAMMRDIYNLGQVLHFKKYRFLRYSYLVFLLGLVAAFMIALLEGLL